MNEQITFYGFGQCGGNIVNELYKKKYEGGVANSTIIDLNAIDSIPSDRKFHIPNSNGCAKDRQLGFTMAERYKDALINHIMGINSTAKKIILAFSLGGGTGSSVGIYVLNELTKRYADKSFGAIVVLPSDEESLQTHVNAIESYQQLIAIKGINIIPLCNTKNKDKVEINKIFAENFDTFMSTPQANVQGNVDYNEIEKMLNCSGVMIMGQLENAVIKNNIHPKTFPNARFMLLATNGQEEIDMPRIYENFGVPKDDYKGYDCKTNFIAFSGISPYLDRIKELSELVQEGKSKMKKAKGFFVEVPSLDDDEDEVVEEFDKVFSNYLYKKGDK